MDNCSTHQSQELKDICAAAGVVLAFLPPYSPDYNPIEESFHDLKAWMKRNRDLLPLYQDNFAGFIELAVNQMADKAGNHFKNSGIRVD